VQSLNEVSISDVIDALDGGSGAGLVKAAPRPQTAPPPRREPVAVKAVEPVKVPEPARRVEAVVREEKSAPAAAAPPPLPHAPEPETKPAAGTADFWPQLVNLVQERRPLAVSWLQAASLLGITGKVIKIGFPTTEGFARDSLMRPAQLSFLEGLAQELLGQAMRFELVLDASLKAPAFSEIGLGLMDEPPAAAKPKPEPKVEARPAPKEELKKAPIAEEPPAPKPDDDYFKDPLVQAALVKFKAKFVAAG